MPAILGPGRLKHLQTRRAPHIVRHLVCLSCPHPKGGYYRVVKVRVFTGGLERPGVACPKCHQAWIETEDQPEVMQPAQGQIQ